MHTVACLRAELTRNRIWLKGYNIYSKINALHGRRFVGVLKPSLARKLKQLYRLNRYRFSMVSCSARNVCSVIA